jgi:hypothetical protein
MASGQGISGVAVALATGGGVLLYAGFQGLNPLQALKDITSGQTKELAGSQVSYTRDLSRIGGGVAQASTGGGSVGSGAHPEIAQAALRHRDEKYSQTKRWAPGYSDCSSFVGKSLKDVGITPPSGSVTSSYLTWRQLKTISRAEIGAGDLLCAGGHIAIALSPTTAIGQQNGRQNVRVDTISTIMWGQGAWVPRRYTGAATGAGSGLAAA